MANKRDRDAELCGLKEIKEQIIKLGASVQKGYDKQKARAEQNRDHWDAYNCRLTDRQFYNGTSTIALPFIRDAVDARKTRYTNQLFPMNQRYVDVVSANGDLPTGEMAVLEHYVRAEKLRSRVVRPLLVNGDLEGQYTIYASWREHKRNIATKKMVPVEMDGEALPEEAADPVEDIVEEEIVDAGPAVEIISDNDLLVLPQTSDTIDDAIRNGGSVTVLRRWSKEMVSAKKAAKEIDGKVADQLKEIMGNEGGQKTLNAAKQAASAAGVKADGGDKTALVYEIWAMLKIDGDRRLCRIYYAGPTYILSVKLCPYWCDKVPVISAPVEKVASIFKGRAPVADVLDLQILANDIMNEGADTGHFSAMPITMSDPEKNPSWDTMILGPGAVWRTSPQSTQFIQFPDMWRSMAERANQLRQQIFETLSVNASMVPSGSAKGKKSQAEIANEQQVDILQTADAVTIIEEAILSPLLERFAEYDAQFRDKPLTVRAFGELGRKAVMQEIEPIQRGVRHEYRWFGVEASRNAAQNQQQIAALNVMQHIPPQLLPGLKLDFGPALTAMVENVFGPRIGPLTLSAQQELSVDPQIENDLLEHGFDTPVHPADDDMAHMQAHMVLMRIGDPHGTIRKHLTAHQTQMQAKAMAQHQAMSAPQGGAPQGGGPRPGAVPSGPQSQPNAPGSIPHDQMASAGAPVMPRRM